MNLRIIKSGVLDTVQDAGRFGWQHLGINPGGAMDKVSAQLANALVGNEFTQPVIELHFPAAAFFFEEPALIALTGADFSPSLNGEPIPWNQPVLVSKYSILQFHRIEKGSRSYLSVHGGLDIKLWLNSFSTNIKASIGGFNGRSLQKDDEIRMLSTIDLHAAIGKKEFEVFSWKTDSDWKNSDEMLVLPGPDWELLNGENRNIFLEQSFTILPQSDRMGYCLEGQAIKLKVQEERVSMPTCFGTIQLLPDGQLIILMADHQTTGGYPVLGNVITTNHSKLAQMKPGEKIRFQFTDQANAEDLLITQQKHLLQIKHACKLKLEKLLHA